MAGDRKKPIDRAYPAHQNFSKKNGSGSGSGHHNLNSIRRPIINTGACRKRRVIRSWSRSPMAGWSSLAKFAPDVPCPGIACQPPSCAPTTSDGVLFPAKMTVYRECRHRKAVLSISACPVPVEPSGTSMGICVIGLCLSTILQKFA